MSCIYQCFISTFTVVSIERILFLALHCHSAFKFLVYFSLLEFIPSSSLFGFYADGFCSGSEIMFATFILILIC